MARLLMYFFMAMVVVGIAFWAISSFYFDRLIREELNQLEKSGHDSAAVQELFNYSDLQDLPNPVRRYLRKAIPDSFPIINTAKMKHSGYFRIAPDTEWWPVSGEQYYRTDDPAFLWIGTVKPMPILWIKARDKYLEGEGEVHVRLLSAVTVAKMTSSEVNQSAFIRFVGEMPWFPTTFLTADYLSWEAIDDQSARAVISDYGITASVTFYFNEQDEITRFYTQDRYRDQTKEDFTGYYRNYQTMNGVLIPMEVEVEWNRPDSNFSYARFVVEDITYNQ
jgi:hypothetical protein